ncbi:hypothetical protein BamMEX5DRAFT_2256 [Burkholderia ambifaria MEX-5]|uniref:Polyketide synthase dehydratase domain-containing protein n=1 Tax=Burkholderia ambifaria MEX-5 TaxID=396597 RepID=B1T390_9BURK|nr:hypothetical protein BamMEX5DRAFT_2256 [Burkholderia ambifaria MEX-5]
MHAAIFMNASCMAARRSNRMRKSLRLCTMQRCARRLSGFLQGHYPCGSPQAHGANVDPDRFVPDAPRAALPPYPWQRDRFWLTPTGEGYGLVNRRREHPLLGYRLHEHAFGWENQLDPAKLPMLADHVVDGGVAFPGARRTHRITTRCRSRTARSSSRARRSSAPASRVPWQARRTRFRSARFKG